MSRTRSARRLAAVVVATLSVVPLGAQCSPYGSWQSASAAPSIPGLPIGPSDVLGAPAVLFSGAIAGSPVPYYLWDGIDEHPLAAGPGRTIHFVNGAIPYDSPSGPVIAVRGLFEIAGVTTVLAFWDGFDWQLPGVAVLGVVNAFAVFPDSLGDELWIGGEIAAVGGTIYGGAVARYGASGWDEPAQVSGSVERIAVALEPSGAVLYLEGVIVAVDGAPFWNIARFDGASWDGLGGGTTGDIEEISVIEGTLGPELWVAGDLSTIGGVPVDDLARWRSGSWEALPPPVPLMWGGGFVRTAFIEVSTEYGPRVAPILNQTPAPALFGYLGWDETMAAWVDLTANPAGGVRFQGSPLLPAGVYRRSTTGPVLQHWCHDPEHPYARGDANGDGAIDLGDPIRLLEIQFLGAAMENCPARYDVNHDGATNISDTIYLLGALFPPPGSPPNTILSPSLPNCGLDPDPVGLFCFEPQGGC